MNYIHRNVFLITRELKAINLIEQKTPKVQFSEKCERTISQLFAELIEIQTSLQTFLRL